jgi:phage tail-like protein
VTFPRSPFNARPGIASGRLDPSTGWTPADGTAAFVLGSAIAGDVQTLQVGDFIEAYQYTDLSTGSPTFLRLRVHVRPPAAMPVGVYWRFTFMLDATARVTLDLTGSEDREMTLTDFAMPLRGVTAADTRARVTARLELMGAAPGDEHEVELPAVYVDSWTLGSDAARPTLINRVPSPNDPSVPVDSRVYLEIADPSVTASFGGNIDLSGGGGYQPTRVYVNDVLALEGTTFQTGWDGPDSALTGFDGNRTVGILLDPTTQFDPQTLVTVRVETRVKASDPVVLSYSFTTEDLVAPQIASVQATARRAVRVVLTEDVLGEDPAGLGDATNPDNWALSLRSTSLDDGLPAYVPAISSVTAVGPREYDLELAAELTPGALYRVTAGPIEDLVGNAMVSPINVADFYGFQPAVPAGRSFDLLSMLPALNVEEDVSRDLERFEKCLQEVTNQLLTDIDEWSDILDPDVAPERFVDAMLADLGNPFPFVLDLIDKRRLIRVLVPLYRQKGTDPGIINAVPAFDEPWLLGVGELGVDTYAGSSELRDRLSFWVDSPIELTAEQRRRITKIADYMKRAETHLLGILEPEAAPTEPDHWELGLSELGVTTSLH